VRATSRQVVGRREIGDTLPGFQPGRVSPTKMDNNQVLFAGWRRQKRPEFHFQRGAGCSNRARKAAKEEQCFSCTFLCPSYPPLSHDGRWDWRIESERVCGEMSSEAAMVADFSPLRLELFAACNQHAHRYEYDGAVRRVSVESQKQRSGGGMEEATGAPTGRRS
jgi:hypothetical protein